MVGVEEVIDDVDEEDIHRGRRGLVALSVAGIMSVILEGRVEVNDDRLEKDVSYEGGMGRDDRPRKMQQVVCIRRGSL